MTLVEVIVSLLLLSLMAVTLLAIFVPTATWISRAGQDTKACNYAAAILEDLRVQRTKLGTYTDLGVSPDVLGLSTINYKPDDEPEMTAALFMEPRMDHADEEGIVLYDVTVRVDWSEGGQERSLKLSTIMGKDQVS